jgi:hypothetical protein
MFGKDKNIRYGNKKKKERDRYNRPEKPTGQKTVFCCRELLLFSLSYSFVENSLNIFIIK